MSASSTGEYRSPLITPRRIIVFAVLFMLLVPLSSCVVWRVGNSSALKKLEKTARDRGEPFTYSELAATYPSIPDDKNIYIALENLWASEDPQFWEAFRAGSQPPDQKSTEYPAALPVLGQDWRWSRTSSLDAKGIAAMDQFLASKSNHLAAIREALKRPQYRARYDFKKGLLMLMPNLSHMKREAQLFQLNALQAMQRGDNAQAIKSIEQIAKIGHCLDEDPTLIGQLVRIAVFNITINTAERLLSLQSLSQSELARLEEVVLSLDARSGLKRSLLSERITGMGVYQYPSDQLSDFPMPPSFRLLALTGLRSADLRLMAETYAQLIQISEDPKFAQSSKFAATVQEAAARADRIPPKVMSALMLPALEKSADKFARIEALRRCSVVAIKIERRTAHTTTSPEMQERFLQSLPNNLGLDPFTGKPLLWKETPSGFVVYSVGTNRHDDGGQVEAADGTYLPGQPDIGFTVEHNGQN